MVVIHSIYRRWQSCPNIIKGEMSPPCVFGAKCIVLLHRSTCSELQEEEREMAKALGVLSASRI